MSDAWYSIAFVIIRGCGTLPAIFATMEEAVEVSLKIQSMIRVGNKRDNYTPVGAG